MTRLLARALQGSGSSGYEISGTCACRLDTVKVERTMAKPGSEQLDKFRDIVHVQQLIDLTDKPIRLTRDEIGWARVKSNASNCVCCCCNNSITLVTTDDSYVLDHIPLDNIEAAQANSSLQYLALANDEKLAIIELVENKPCSPGPPDRAEDAINSPRLLANARADHDSAGRTRFVNLSALGLSMSDVLFWRWIDDLTLALVTQETLYTCQVDQIQINHPAATALVGHVNQLLSLTRVCDVDPNLSQLCQVTNVQRDLSTNLYAISGLYSTQDISLKPYRDTQSPIDDISNPLVKSSHNQNEDNNNNNNNNNNNKNGCYHAHYNHNSNACNNSLVKQKHLTPGNLSLRHNFSSVPGRLSQLAMGGGSQPGSLDANMRTPKSRTISSLRRKISASSRAKRSSTTEGAIATVGGLAQIYCKLRDCSQVIRAHAVSFASKPIVQMTMQDGKREVGHSTTLVAANLSGNKLKVYFNAMATTDDLITSGQNAARSIKLDPIGSQAARMDFPTAIVCSALTPDDERTHVAMVVTKYGHLFVCSITQGSFLFDVQISHDLVSGAVLESKSRGLMLICRNGQVLLVRLNEDKLVQIFDDVKTMRHVPSQRSIAIDQPSPVCHRHSDDPEPRKLANKSSLEPLDIGLEVIISTKL